MLAVIKNGQQSPLKGHHYEFLPIIFSNLRHLECQTFKHKVYLKVLALNKVIHFSKRALHTGTARSTWRKCALSGKFFLCGNLFVWSPGQEFLRDCLRYQMKNSPNMLTSDVCQQNLHKQNFKVPYSRTQDLLVFYLLIPGFSLLIDY